jgi:mxaJ protein
VSHAAAALLALAALAARGASAPTAASASTPTPPKASAPTLVVCADPNNLPFSNMRGQGFENKLVDILATDLGMRVEWVWWAQRRGFARHTVGEARCDLWPGVAQGIETMSTSRPYYHSSYVFVTRASRDLRGLSLDDPRLRRLVIGVELVGYDAINTPPALALAERGLTQNIRGFMVFGDYRRHAPTAAIVEAVVKGSIDTAIVWGPVAGYFAHGAAVPLRLEPVPDDRQWKMEYGISVGIRRGVPALKERIDAALVAEQTAIDTLLSEYRVPRLPQPLAVSVSPHPPPALQGP